jgi:YD repeat-containing protein
VSISYSYTNVNNAYNTWRVVRTDPSGSRTYDSRITPGRVGGCTEVRPGITRFVDELNRQTLYQYDNGDRLTKVTFPEGNAIEYIPGATRPTDIIYHSKNGSTETVHQVFPSCTGGYNGTAPDKVCFKPTSITDARGQTTNFTYDPAHGGLLTKTDPPDANGVRPQTRYSYVQRYAWIKSSGGGYSHAASPVWLLASEKFCKTTAASGAGCAGGSSDEVVTTYDYGPDSGPNNLWLRGKIVTANGVSLRTCYRRDNYGQIIAQTSPNANLTSCP